MNSHTIIPTVDCPRCGKPCPIGPHQSAHCTRCFTSFRADNPNACLTHSERILRATDDRAGLGT